MKLLEERIVKDGKVFPCNILKVDSFLNHQLDVNLFNEMGKEWYRLFKDSGVNKILTIEASGIAVAVAAGATIITKALVEAGEWETITANAKAHVDKVKSC